MSEGNTTSNPLVAELRGPAARALGIRPLLLSAADEIERLTAELTSRAALREALKVTEDEVIELKAERDRLRQQVTEGQYRDELSEESERLRAALSEYGKHHDYCPRYLKLPPVPCECGFSAALAGAADETVK